MYLWLFFTINNINPLRLCVIWHKYSLFFTNHTFHFPDLMSLTITKMIVSWHARMFHEVVCRNLQIRTNAYCRHVNAFYRIENPSEFSIAKKTSSSFYESLSINPYWKNLFLLLLFSGYCSRICSFIIPVSFFTE